jgi:cellulose synthase/poly-beta-1,6-N-acetylglucosamine synthase-like glycosyltransferase
MGKTNAQNIAVRHARNDVLVFSDATTLYDRNALRYLAAAYADPSVGAVSGRYDYYDANSQSAMGSGSATFWSLESWIKRAQSRIFTLSGCCGCIYSVRRSLYTELAPETISDLVQPLHVLLQGYRVVFEERAQAWEEATASAGEEMRMRIRVAVRGMKGLLSVKSLLNPALHPWIAFQLWSHKIARWCVPLHLLAIFAGSALLSTYPFVRALLLAQVIFYAWAAAAIIVPAMKRSRLLGLPLYFCTINAAFLVAMVNVMKGRQYNVWQPIRR